MGKSLRVLGLVVFLGGLAGLVWLLLPEEGEQAEKLPLAATTRSLEPRPEGQAARPQSHIASVPFSGKADSKRRKKGAAGRLLAALAGRVVDEGGHPLAGVPLRLIFETTGGEMGPVSPAPRAARAARTDARGRFLWGDLPLFSKGHLRAEPKQLCAASAAFHLERPGTTTLADLVVRRGGSLGGRLVDREGRPLPGVVVSAWPVRAKTPFGLLTLGTARARSGVRKSPSAQDGRFLLEGLEPGPLWLMAGGGALRIRIKKNLTAVRGKLLEVGDLILLEGQSLAGLVRAPSGEPLKEVRLTLTPHAMRVEGGAILGLRDRRVRSAPDGSFRFEGLDPAGVYDLRAELQGYLPLTRGKVGGGTGALNLELKPGGMLWGRVRRAADGEPLHEYHLRLVGSGGPAAGPGFSVGILRGEQAAERLGLPPAPELFAVVGLGPHPIRLLVVAAGLAAWLSPPEEVAPGDRRELQPALLPELFLRGRVLDPTGEPVSGAGVRVQLMEEHEIPKGVSFELEESGGLTPAAPGSLVPVGPARFVITQEDGSFSLKGLGTGRLRLVASFPGLIPSLPRDLELLPSIPPPALDLLLRAGGRLEGRTVDADGHPLMAARVSLAPQGVSGASPQNTTSDARGRFSFESLLPGRWRARLLPRKRAAAVTMEIVEDHQDAAPPGRLVTIVAGGTSNLVLQKARTASLRGQVRESGAPLAGVRVSLQQEGRTSFLGGPSATTDDQGRFLIEEVTPGDYELTAAPPEAPRPFRRQIHILPRQRNLEEIDLPTGSLSGRVVDEASGRGLAGLEIDVARDDRPLKRQVVRAIVLVATSKGAAPQTLNLGPPLVHTADKGQFLLRYLEAGTYALTLRGGGYISQTFHGFKVIQGQRTSTRTLKLRRGLGLTVRAETHGSPPAFLFCTLRRPGSSDVVAQGTSRGGKPVHLGGLEPGPYRVTLESSLDQHQGSATITLRPGPEPTLTIPLSSAR